MGLACRGLTHCHKCGKSLKHNEYYICNNCEKISEKSYKINENKMIEIFKGIKRHKKIIADIDKDFFFKFGETLLSEIEKQDKIINLMAEYIERHKHIFMTEENE